MRLTELSQWHLAELDELSKVIPVKMHDEHFEFWSGNRKLGNTVVVAFEGGFALEERYGEGIVEKPYGNLTDWFYGEMI